jgi:hypothetical protein
MSDKDLQHDAMSLLAKEARGVLDGKELVNWATQALNDGHDTPALVTLAGLDMDSPPLLSETMPAFRAALVQLGIPVPANREGVLRAHGVDIARQISVGALTPSEGVLRMECEVVSPLDHPIDLMAWCYLNSDLHPDTLAELSGIEWERYVLELAGSTSSMESTPTLAQISATERSARRT